MEGINFCAQKCSRATVAGIGTTVSGPGPAQDPLAPKAGSQMQPSPSLRMQQSLLLQLFVVGNGKEGWGGRESVEERRSMTFTHLFLFQSKEVSGQKQAHLLPETTTSVGLRDGPVLIWSMEFHHARFAKQTKLWDQLFPHRFGELITVAGLRQNSMTYFSFFSKPGSC